MLKRSLISAFNFSSEGRQEIRDKANANCINTVDPELELITNNLASRRYEVSRKGAKEAKKHKSFLRKEEAKEY
jgi:hypothetical protein